MTRRMFTHLVTSTALTAACGIVVFACVDAVASSSSPPPMVTLAPTVYAPKVLP